MVSAIVFAVLIYVPAAVLAGFALVVVLAALNRNWRRRWAWLERIDRAMSEEC